jgi:hypothetical protein
MGIIPLAIITSALLAAWLIAKARRTKRITPERDKNIPTKCQGAAKDAERVKSENCTASGLKVIPKSAPVGVQMERPFLIAQAEAAMASWNVWKRPKLERNAL